MIFMAHGQSFFQLVGFLPLSVCGNRKQQIKKLEFFRIIFFNKKEEIFFNLKIIYALSDIKKNDEFVFIVGFQAGEFASCNGRFNALK